MTLPVGDSGHRAELGLLGILRDTFGLFGKHPVYLIIVGLAFFWLFTSVIELSWEALSQGHIPLGYNLAQTLILFANITVSFLLQAILTMSVISLVQEGRAQFWRSIFRTLRLCLPILILCWLSLFFVSGGLVVLVLPGLYLLAVVFVIMPVILQEGRGFSAIRRCVMLSRDYRLPMMALMVFLIAITVGKFMLEAQFYELYYELLYAMFPEQTAREGMDALLVVEIIIASTIRAGMEAVFFPVGVIMSVVTYLRLVHIKEGGEASQLLKVFE